MVTLQWITEKMILVIQVRPKNGQSGNDEGTSICAMYTMGNIGLAACKLETSFTNMIQTTY